MKRKFVETGFIVSAGPAGSAKKARAQFIPPRRVTGRSVFQKQRNIRTGGFIGIEKKFLDTTHAATALTVTWAGGEKDPTTFLGITSVGQGNGESQHLGRKFTVTDILIRGFFGSTSVKAQTNPIDNEIVRIIVVLDTQTNGAQLNAEDVMADGTGSSVHTFRNLQFVKRFKVLKDKSFVFNHQGQSNEGAVNSFAAPQSLVPFKFNIKFKKGLVVNTTNTAAIIADMQDNSVHVIACGTDTAQFIQYTCRTRFFG